MSTIRGKPKEDEQEEEWLRVGEVEVLVGEDKFWLEGIGSDKVGVGG